MNEDLDSLYDEAAREGSFKSLVRLAGAIAERTPGENNFAQEWKRTELLFEQRIAELKQTENTDQSTAEEFMRDKLHELRQWLSFLDHRYKGAKASSKTARYLRKASQAVSRIHSLRLEQATRHKESAPLFKKIIKSADNLGFDNDLLGKLADQHSLRLSETAYKKVRKQLWRVYFRYFGRALKRHTFLLIASFIIAGYMLGALPGIVAVSDNKIVNWLITFLGAFGAWAVDKWLLSPRIDRRLRKSRGAHLEANLGDLRDAFRWALMCRVYSSSIIHEMLDSSNEEYKEIAELLIDPKYPMGGYGLI